MNSERGNIIVYLLVGLALFGAMLGSIWWVKNRLASTSQPQTAVNTPAAPSDEAKKDDTAETKVDQGASPAQESSGTQPAPQDAPGASAPSSTPASGSGSAMPPQDDTPPTPRPESQTAHTPSPRAVASSGPLEDTVLSSVLLGVATFAGHSFVRSRRLSKTL